MARGFIKICGVTTSRDTAAAVELGADLVGINLFPASPRYAKPESVPEIVAALGSGVEAVAVMVQPTRIDVEALAPSLATRAVIQWHAPEQEPRPWLRKPLIAAFGIASRDDVLRISRYLARCRETDTLPRAILIDSVARNLHGGSGQVAPWGLLEGFDPGVPWILAGGLTPENVALAIRTVRPAGVDVASGVEESPGRKCPVKMRRFMEAAREAFERN
jgi:phosphoribosylanthranilate isomerase